MTDASSLYSSDPRQVSLAKALKDSGFDSVVPVGEGWLRGVSLASPLVVHVRWIGAEPELAVPKLSVLAPALAAAGIGTTSSTATYCQLVSVPPIPGMGVAFGQGTANSEQTACSIPNLQALYTALAAAFSATRGIGLLTPVEAFTLTTQSLPKTTEAERLVVQRVGQQLFREALEKRWNGRCAITGIEESSLLRASHIKPWAKCATDAERLDPDNGLLLAANWDAVFDKGLVTFNPSGMPLWSPRCTPSIRSLLGLHDGASLALSARSETYMAWHRDHEFQP